MYFLLITILIVIIAIIILTLRFVSKKNLLDSLRYTLILIKIPKSNLNEKNTNQERIDFKTELIHFEELIVGLLPIKKPFTFEVAVPHLGEEIFFYLSVPKISSEIAIKQIQGLWDGASVSIVEDDFTIFNSNGFSSSVYLAQKENYALPIRTYTELGIDSFEPILGAFTKINEIGEGAALQIILKPAPKEAKKKIYGYISALKKGEPIKKVFQHDFPFSFSEISNALNPSKEEEEKKERIIDEEAVKALQSKISKPLFSVNVRIVASAASQFQANDILEGISAGFNHFGAPLRNEFKIIKPRNQKQNIKNFIYRLFVPSQSMVLSTEEITSFFHLPISSTLTPRVKWLKSKEAPPPSNLPTKGLLLGDSIFRGQKKSIYMTDEDRRRHIYILGQTGTGKSTLLGNMIIEDIQAGKGVAIIDPHGDLAENALGFIPKNRIDDVIYFNPGDIDRPMGLNMLDYNFNRPEEKTFIVNEIQSIFNKLFPPETMGPMFEQYMRNALLLLMEDLPNEAATFTEVPRIFTDSEYRLRKLSRIKNPVVVDFWEKEASKAGGEASLANMTPYITSKFNNFISNDYMRPIIGQPKSAFNFREVMDSGKILLVNLSKGKIGDINAGLLGMIFTGKILMAALSRADIKEGEGRRDFNLYIDEFQNFATDSISTILSEARKYRLNLVIAHQFIAQLTEKIRDSVFGNVGSQIVFRIGADDAEFIVKQFSPVFNENDLINIDNMNAHTKLLINGATSNPFNMRIRNTSWGGGDRVLAEKIKEISRLKYGVDRDFVEQEIFERLRD